MEVKKGYKQTEVGVIPEDWEVSLIGEVSCIATGNKNTQDRVEDGEFPFFVRSQSVERINTYTFDGEAVLTAGDGVGTGKVFHYINGKFDTHQRVYRISHFSERVNGRFFYLFFSTYFYERIVHLTAKSSVDSVRREMISRMPMPVPKLSEQEAIAGALSDADAWIESLEQLIAKKRQIKQGAMQELLTGKRRLPGFEVNKPLFRTTPIGPVPIDWGLCSVRDEYDIQLGKMLDAEKNSGVPKPYLGNRAVQWGYIDLSYLSEMALSNSDMMRFRLQAGDLLVCEGGEVGRAAIWQEQLDECYFQKAIHRLRAKKCFNSRLMLAFLHKWSKEGRLSHFVTQTSIAHLPKDKLETIPLPKPSLAEQNAIAQVLADFDSEVSRIEATLAKARKIKQGMMQELLTGRIRLV